MTKFTLPVFDLLDGDEIEHFQDWHSRAFDAKDPLDTLQLAKALMRICHELEGDETLRSRWSRASMKVAIPLDGNIAQSRAKIFEMIRDAADQLNDPAFTRLEAACRLVGYGIVQNLDSAQATVCLAAERGGSPEVHAAMFSFMDFFITEVEVRRERFHASKGRVILL